MVVVAVVVVCRVCVCVCVFSVAYLTRHLFSGLDARRASFDFAVALVLFCSKSFAPCFGLQPKEATHTHRAVSHTFGLALPWFWPYFLCVFGFCLFVCLFVCNLWFLEKQLLQSPFVPFERAACFNIACCRRCVGHILPPSIKPFALLSQKQQLPLTLVQPGLLGSAFGSAFGSRKTTRNHDGNKADPQGAT